jgi:hypothetical protein
MRETATYLDLSVGPFRLALGTHYVVAVDQNVALTETRSSASGVVVGEADVRGERIPTLLLSPLPPGQPAPFVVALDANDHRIAIGADRVGYLQGQDATRLAVPRFGMLLPDLLEGAIRDRHGLLLLLAPSALARLATEPEPGEETAPAGAAKRGR